MWFCYVHFNKTLVFIKTVLLSTGIYQRTTDPRDDPYMVLNLRLFSVKVARHKEPRQHISAVARVGNARGRLLAGEQVLGRRMHNEVLKYSWCICPANDQTTSISQPFGI